MTTQVYKLTTQENTTRNNTLWGENVSHESDGSGDLCSKGWLHAYTDKYLAVLLNPIHANIRNPKLWVAYGNGQRKDDNGLKVGFTKLMTKKTIALPEISLTQKIAFGILCALEVYKEPTFVRWANEWLSGKDRSKEAARGAMAEAAGYAANAAGYAADYAADYAATAAEDAARCAASAARCAASAAMYAAKGAADYAATAAEDAARCAASAAMYAAKGAAGYAARFKPINLEKLARKAMKVK